ncbi:MULTISPECIES: hypothetical protein [Niastella]|uniref:Uncharacterized protein n=1 Tax=Niastella soli TaxID=2821487 RepID=A0ABS3YLX1_9BACT|nr:hypothetical protein [Niastella soli]MBO9198878.1 hypothetical protein [Niastella soli]
MHNPFVLLTTRLLESLIKADNTFFVRQTYPRGKNLLDPLNKAAFLFTHYTDYSRAKTHYDALDNDPNKFLYNINEPEHYEKLFIAAGQPEGFHIYSPLVPQPWKPTAPIATRIRNYINQKMNWNPGRSEGVKADLFVQFGELFITLKLGIHEVKLPLAEIENF